MQKASGQIKPAAHPTGIGAATSVDPRFHTETVDQIVNSMISI
jgi:hypothetical protein